MQKKYIHRIIIFKRMAVVHTATNRIIFDEQKLNMDKFNALVHNTMRKLGLLRFDESILIIWRASKLEISKRWHTVQHSKASKMTS